MLKPPAVTPAGTMTKPGTEATVGLLLATWKKLSIVEGVAMVRVAKEEPPTPIVEVGLSARDVGATCGTSVSCDWALAPFQVAVIVAVVFAATAFVGRRNEAEKSPGATVTVAGGLTAGELLDRPTTAPPGGAWPCSITIAPAETPPLIALGEIESDASEGGSTVRGTEAEAELRVAARVTVVGTTTCPTCIWNCVQARLPGIGTVAGTGAAVGFEVERATAAPAAGAAVASWSSTHVVSPLWIGLITGVSDTGVGGTEGTVNVPVADHAVKAPVVGEESPWNDRTRQNFVPDVSESTVRVGSFSCPARSSIGANWVLPEISRA